MKKSWLPTILLSVACVVACDLTGEPCTCTDNPPNVQYVSVNGSASVHCPNLTRDMMNFHLYRCPVYLNISVRYNRTSKYAESLTPDRPGYNFRVNGVDGTATFILSGVTQSDLYACEAFFTYPPPYEKAPGLPPTIVLLKESHQCPKAGTTCGPQAKPLLPWVLLGVTALYSLVITGVAFFIWSLRGRRVDFHQHDYINMKPRGPKRNQGVQHPVRCGRY